MNLREYAVIVSLHKLSILDCYSMHIINFACSLVLVISVWHNTVHRGGHKSQSEREGGWSSICLIAAMEYTAKPWQC